MANGCLRDLLIRGQRRISSHSRLTWGTPMRSALAQRIAARFSLLEADLQLFPTR
jgi:hypothetical protein